MPRKKPPPSTGVCHYCGNPTENPQYCDRSCAAKANNKKIGPRRKPEGKCQKCGTAVRTVQRLCERCQVIASREAVEAQQNLQRTRNLAGEIETESVPELYVSKQIVFTVHISRRGKKYQQDEPCGTLLDALVSVALSGIPYLHPQDGPRTASMLRELKRFAPVDYASSGSVGKAVADWPIRKLDYLMKRWIDDLLQKNDDPLLVTFALGAVEFVDAHLRFESYGDWRIKPVVEAFESSRFSNALHDSRIKREVSMRIGGIQVWLTVPEGAEVLDDGKPVVRPGQLVQFEVTRCHLSDNYYDREDLEIREAHTPEFDIFRDFRLHGHAIPVGGPARRYVNGIGWITAPCPTLKAPIRWITHLIDYSGVKPQSVPIPNWSCDAAKPASSELLRVFEVPEE